MALRFQTFAALGSRTADSPRGSGEPKSTRIELATLTLEADPRSSSGDLIAPTDLGLGVEIVELELERASIGTNYSARAIKGRDQFQLVDITGVPSNVAQVEPLRDTTPVVSSGMIVDKPSPSVSISAAAASSLDVSEGDTVTAVLHVRDALASEMGRSLIGRYIDDATDREPETYNTTTVLMSELGFYGNQTPLGMPGSTMVYCVGAALTSIDPSNSIFISATDIGVGGTKIPAEISSNTPQQYAYYPNVFMRRAQYTRAVVPVGTRKESITSTSGAATIFVAQYDFEYSKWQVQIDGTECEIIIDHNGGTYQRPIDIYQNVIVPKLTDGAIDTYEEVDTGAGPSFHKTSKLTRFNFSQYFRFITGYNTTEADPAFAVYAQNGNEPEA